MRIADDGRIILTNNPGIQFGADNTNASPGGNITAITSQTLDDYEEGTWTVSFNSSKEPDAGREGSYTKIGRQVTASFKIQLGAGTQANNTQYIFDGLPFTVSNSFDSGAQGGGVLTFHSVMRPNESIHLYPNRNTSRFSCYEGGALISRDADNTDLNTANIFGTLTYFTDD